MNRAANDILEGIWGSIVKGLAGQPQEAACWSWRIDPDTISVSSLDAREGWYLWEVDRR